MTWTARLCAMACVVACGGACTRPASTPQAGVRLAVADSPELGRYLTDAARRPVYVRVASGPDAAKCDDECAAVWPPVASPQPPAQSDEPAVQQELVATTIAHDGSVQLTYAKRPLHYRARPDVPAGPERSVTDQWGRWSLVFPHGEPMVP